MFLHFSHRSRGLLVAAGVTASVALAASAAFAGSAVYAYDNLGRLSRATYSNGVVIVYAYDAAGNRTSVVITGAP